jgi:hypothetical protein
MSASRAGSSMTQRSTILPSHTSTNSWPSKVKRLPSAAGREKVRSGFATRASVPRAGRLPIPLRGFRPFGRGRLSSLRGGSPSACRGFPGAADRDRRNRPPPCRGSRQVWSVQSRSGWKTSQLSLATSRFASSSDNVPSYTRWPSSTPIRNFPVGFAACRQRGADRANGPAS